MGSELVKNALKIGSLTDETRTLEAMVLIDNHEVRKAIELICNSQIDFTFKNPDHQGYSLLHYAVLSGSMELVRVLINQGSPVDLYDEAGWTPLHYASSFAKQPLMQFLIESGANFNARNTNFNSTPLHLAVSANSKPCIEYLLSLEALEKSVPDRYNLSPLDTAF